MNGKKISEIINQSIANQTVLKILANKESENLTSENYWDKIGNVADMVAEQKEQNGERFYISFYWILFEMTTKYIDTDKVYNQNDYEEFKKRMEQIYKRADVPIDFMNEIGLTPDKLFLKAISEKINFEKRTEQITALLEIAKNNMTLGKATNDLQDFAINISIVYDELKNGDNQELLEQYINTLLEAYYTTLKEATNYEKRHGKKICIEENAQIDKILQDLILTPKVYSNPNAAKNMFDKYPRLYGRTAYNMDFYKMIIRDLPEDKQEEFKGSEYIYDGNIKSAILEKNFPNIGDVTFDKLGKVGDIAKFYIVYDFYHKLIERGDNNRAEEFWKTFYDQEKISTNDASTSSLCDETLQLIAEAPEEVNRDSIKKVTNQFREALLEKDGKTSEVKGE